MNNKDNLELERRWQYSNSERLMPLPLIKKYSNTYIQYLNNYNINSNIFSYRRETNKLISDEILDVVELLAELDVLNQLKRNNQTYCHLTHKLQHVYSENYWFVHSYRPSRMNSSSFIFYLYNLMENKQIDSINSKASKLLGFYFALYIFSKHFRPNNNLH